MRASFTLAEGLRLTSGSVGFGGTALRPGTSGPPRQPGAAVPIFLSSSAFPTFDTAGAFFTFLTASAFSTFPALAAGSGRTNASVPTRLGAGFGALPFVGAALGGICGFVGGGDFVFAAKVFGDERCAVSCDLLAGGWTAGDGGWFVDVGQRLVRIVGDLADHFFLVEIEADAADVADGGVEGTEDEFAALEFEGAAEQSVDDFHEGGLDGFGVLEEGGAKDAGVGEADGAEHALVEVAELLSAEGGGAAADAGDFDMSAGFGVRH
jgi:hypothetical protein